MAYEKPWYFGSFTNGTSADVNEMYQCYLIGFKKALLDSTKWTIYGCCGKNNGGTLTAPSSLVDTTDRWQVFSDITGGNGSLSSAQGWIILYNSTLALYLVMSYYNGSNGINIYFTKTAPTLNTTTTYHPVVSSANINWTGFASGSVYTGRFLTHFAYTSDGHFVIFITSDNHATIALNLFTLLPVSPSRAADTTPWVASITSAPAANVDTLFASGNSKCFVPLIAPNTPTNSMYLAFTGGSSVNPLSDFTTDAADSYINLFPILIYGNTTNAKTLKGRLQDVFWAPYGLGLGDTTPASGQIEYMKIGPLMLPANTSLVF